MTLGEAIRQERQKRKWTQKDVVNKCDKEVSISYLSELERGVKTNPSAKVLSKLSLALKLNIDYFCKYL